jgi:hypothetical protein
MTVGKYASITTYQPVEEATHMIEQPFITELPLAERLVLRGIVIAADDQHPFVVRVEQGDEDWLIVADLVVSSDKPVRLGPGDAVLCVVEPDDRERGFILGRIGAPSTRDPAIVETVSPSAPAVTEVPDTLVLEAKQSLTLRVGDGSITIRADGKILIKGRDLVSHAQRVNRIKGGSVAIN